DRRRTRGGGSPPSTAIHGYGSATMSWGENLAWEAQEYFALGSLREVIDQAPLDDEHARAVVAAVAECLRHWQEELQHNHTDVKPENRSEERRVGKECRYWCEGSRETEKN